MSRLPSSRGSSAGASTRSGATPAQRRAVGIAQAPKSDIFVALLGISLAAILLATLLMLLLFSRYSFSTKVTATAAPTALTRLA